MQNTSLLYGYVTGYSSTQISLTNYTYSATYYGNSLTYSNSGVKGGTITGYTQWYYSAIDFIATGGNFSASKLYKVLQTGNVNSVLNFVMAGDDYVVGSSYADYLNGLSGADTILGGLGNDTLNGGIGNDTLTGGTGYDTFIFNTKLGTTNRDSITDFSVTDDVIWLENTGIFAALTTLGTLSSAAFHTGTAAGDSADRIIYNSTTGSLSYDVDGSGKKAAVQFATLTTGLALTNADFWVI